MRLNNFITLLMICIVFISACHSTKEITNTDNTQIDSTFLGVIPQKNGKIVTYRNSTFNSQIKTLLCHKKENELFD